MSLEEKAELLYLRQEHNTNYIELVKSISEEYIPNEYNEIKKFICKIADEYLNKNSIKFSF